MKYLIALFIGVLFIGCTVNKAYLEKKHDTLTLNIQNEVIKIETKNKYYSQAGGAVYKNIFFTNDELLVEYVKLKRSYTWTGLAEGFYKDYLRENIQGLEQSQTYKIKNGDVYKFTKNNQYFYLISLYSGDSNLFILDYYGEITSKVLKKNLLIEQKNQLKEKVEKRFLENYQFKDYFERQSSDDPVIIPQN